MYKFEENVYYRVKSAAVKVRRMLQGIIDLKGPAIIIIVLCQGYETGLDFVVNKKYHGFDLLGSFFDGILKLG